MNIIKIARIFILAVFLVSLGCGGGSGGSGSSGSVDLTGTGTTTGSNGNGDTTTNNESEGSTDTESDGNNDSGNSTTGDGTTTENGSDESTADTTDSCSNDIGNGNEIISGPSGPTGEDYDSVFRSLTVDPSDSGTLVIGTERNGFVKSTDGGANWIRLRSGLRHNDWLENYPEIYDIGISSDTTKIIYAGTVDSIGPIYGDYPSSIGGVYKSTDGGETWQRKNCGLTNSYVSTIHVDSRDAASAVIGISGGYPSFSEMSDQFFDGGIYKTTNGGDSWTRISVVENDNNNRFIIIRSATSNPDILITFGANQSDNSLNIGFIRSTDNGSTWAQFAPDLKNKAVSYFDVSSDGNTIYAVEPNDMSIYKSTDAGDTWNQNLINTAGYALSVSPSDGDRLLYTAMYKLYLSTDGLESSVLSLDTEDATIDDIVFAPSDNNIVYAITKGYKLYKSEDAGVSFTLIKSIRDDVLNVIP